jgi:hypothetical protein
MGLYIHDIDPHYSHEFADVCFDGGVVAVTNSPRKPTSSVEFLAVFRSHSAAEFAVNSVRRTVARRYAPHAKGAR